MVFAFIKKFILETPNSFERTVKFAPAIMFLTAFIIALFIFYKGGKGVGLNETELDVAIGISAAIAAVIAVLSLPAAYRIKQRLERLEEEDLANAKNAALENGVARKALEGNHMAADPAEGMHNSAFPESSTKAAGAVAMKD